MECKNCQEILTENAQFCPNCGAKVVLERIHFKKLLIEFFVMNFGVDSRFLLTIRKMATQPEVVINEYLDGVRMRYINPFAFLAVGAGLSLLIFNYFADDFIAINRELNSVQIKEYKEKAAIDISSLKNVSDKEIEKIKIEKKTAQLQLDFLEGMWNFMLRYFNLLTFVFLLIYAVLSKWTFRKPHNFGEHIVMNSFMYGFTTYFALIAFFLSILIHPSIYTFSIFGAILYYMYAFGRVYKLSFGRNILKLFRFLVGIIFVFITLAILAGFIGLLIGYLGLIKF
jgi:hypothetical protein